jgi:hypothetical protein
LKQSKVKNKKSYVGFNKMTTVNPVGGNDSFRGVESLLGPFTQLNTGALSATTVTALDVKSNYLTLSGPGVSTTVYAYAPLSFAGAAAAASMSLYKTPGAATATSLTDSNLFHLPHGAVLTFAYVTNGGTPIVSPVGASYNLGHVDASLAAALTAVPITPFMAGTSYTDVNGTVGGGGVVLGTTVVSAFGSVGTPISPHPIGAFDDNFLNVTVVGAANQAGALTVALTYHIPA